MERDTVLSEKGKKKKKVYVSTQRNLEVRERRLRKIMFSLDFSEVKSSIETKDSMSRL